MACEKISYDSFAEAQSIVNNAQKFGRTGNRRMANKKPKRAYKCEHCGKYHLTSQKKKNPNKTKKDNKTYKAKMNESEIVYKLRGGKKSRNKKLRTIPSGSGNISIKC